MDAGTISDLATGLTRLSHLQPIANGAQRKVFQHPDHPELLIKVLRREFLEPRFGPQGSFHNRHRRCRQTSPEWSVKLNWASSNPGQADRTGNS